jgi:aspartate aminotransferase
MILSNLSHGIQTSPIITLAADINEKIQSGENIYNLTIGDFNPKIFPIPTEFRDEIIAAYNAGYTNYPGAFGLPNLRGAVSNFLARYSDIHYAPDDILISCGARPLIYSAYRAIVDRGEKVIFPVPSWNNDYYSYLTFAEQVMIETTPENNFMPTAEMLEPHLKDAALIALCSPLNPTGTVFSKDVLEEICELVLAENNSRGPDKKPLYVVFDQIYWLLTFGDTQHYNVVKLKPEMREFTVFIDGMSKAFAATGVRLGWGFAAPHVLKKMRTIISHMGAWAPRAEQFAAGSYLDKTEAVDQYIQHIRVEIRDRLVGFYKGFKALKHKGYHVDAIEPQASIYLTVQLDLRGLKTANGIRLETNEDVHRYILEEAKIGLVPMSYFGASKESSWYRLSVGTCRREDIEIMIGELEKALSTLS